MRLAIEISYKGSSYAGWQIQRNSLTVQSVLQEKWSMLFQSSVEITGCGRTDVGVHATQYFLHLDLDDQKLNRINVEAMNAQLPVDLAVKNIYRCHEGFHARYHAYKRKYIYFIHQLRNPFLNDRSFYLAKPNIDVKLMSEASQMLLGQHDFRSFCKSNSGLKNFLCDVSDAQWKQTSEHHFEFHIAANRFLRGMVRLIVGMCLSCNNGKLDIDDMFKSFKSGQPIKPSYSVPPEGLFLTEVHYPAEITADWEKLDFRI